MQPLQEDEVIRLPLPTERPHMKALGSGDHNVPAACANSNCDGEGIWFHIKSPVTSYFDASFACWVVPIPEGGPYHITAFEPHVTKPPVGAGWPRDLEEYGLAHHMDVFLCAGDPSTASMPWLMCAADRFFCTYYVGGDNGTRVASFMTMAFSYDKGAFSTYHLPPDHGILIGEGLAYSTIIFQVHYLTPPGENSAAELIAKQWVDNSMVVLHLTRRLRTHNVGIFSWSDRRGGKNRLAIPHTDTDNGGVMNGGRADGDTTKGRYEHVTRCDPQCLRKMKIGHDLRKFGKVRLVSVKLHAHSHATKMQLVHFSSDGTRTEMLTLDPFCGYGECQQFHNIPASRPPLRAGSTLEVHCWFDNQGQNVIHYGVTNGGEMCAKILMYSPTDTAPFSWSPDEHGMATPSSSTTEKKKNAKGGGMSWSDFG